MRMFRNGLVLALGITMTALGASACSGGGEQTPPAAANPNEHVDLTLATFTEFGYEALIPEYERLHPNIKITHRKTGEGGPYHQDLITKLAAGSGLADVTAVEEGHLSDVLDKGSKFNDLSKIGPADVTPDRWLGWKYDAAKTKDGKVIGYGTDIGPLAMCYRKDLFAAAKLPTDPEAVKPLFATWDSYFAAGADYVKNTGGKAWFDSASQNFNAMVNQLPQGYIGTDDKLAVENNQGIKDAWTKVTDAVAKGESAKLTAFSPEWNSAFKQSAFATKVCPSWMLGVIKEHAGPENAGKWAVTAAFPGGGGNWGGSYLTVPTQSKHPKEAAELAAWLTAPEQQVKAFQAKGNFPSQVKALTDPALLSYTNPYFGDTKIGELFAEQAKKVQKPQYKGPGDGQIQENASSPALQAVEQGKKSPADAWNQMVDAAKKITR
ncbi:carbohydrate ABC transporter substrate-binding protein [Amycolatopsis balhimycina DSM 5908]|uniref:Carbohydrate ABC transporter substrate-binding protein n=1 Tax=Amycolatopsis balhimycina DSM 5908 TaxID=1081091 RepID=A0A428W221_AMYBA|nr:ABC transporter substrate-binding protein [Amycolatopsis balhimycina]RSM37096.1 carbohydrate ABC transporter substrate-binding protein [Amycolatopsis balhimycina DSM 5908]